MKKLSYVLIKGSMNQISKWKLQRSKLKSIFMPSPSLNLPASDRCPEFLPRLPLSPRGNSHIHFMGHALPWRHIHFLRYPNLNSPGIVICLVQTLLTQLLSRFLPYSRALSHSMTSSLRGHIHKHPNPLF